MFKDVAYSNPNPACRNVKCPLRIYVDQRRRLTFSPKNIIRYVADKYHFFPEEVSGDSHRPPVVASRRLTVAMIRAYQPQMKFTAIGRCLNRDRGTVLYLAVLTERAMRMAEKRWNR